MPFSLPPWLAVDIAGTQLWQWIGLALVAVVSALVAWVATYVVTRLVAAVMRRAGSSTLDARTLAIARGPAAAVVAASLAACALPLLALDEDLQRGLARVLQIVVVAALTWLTVRIVDVVTQRLDRRFRAERQTGAASLVAIARKASKVVILVLALVLALDNLGFQVTALVAGLGIGGVAVALAAQKSLENLFGGVTLYADQPLYIGDFCRFGDRLGIVEDIGLRSTRVRTLERTQVTIPNADFANFELENYSRRDKFWFHPVIGITYATTPAQIRAILAAVRDMLREHAHVEPETARIRFIGFGASALDLEIFSYVKARDYDAYLEIAEELNLRILELVTEAGSSFAFPSRTVYLEDVTPPSARRGRRRTGERCRSERRPEAAVNGRA
jgi:MscS family membrane protein